MTWSVTGYRPGATSVVRHVDVAGLVAAAFQRVNSGCQVLPFDTVQALTPQYRRALRGERVQFEGSFGDRHFLINAAPGAGKTFASCAIAQTLIQKGEIDRVVVIAPRNEVVSQWSKDFRAVTGRPMFKVTAADEDICGMEMDVCATWSAVQVW